MSPALVSLADLVDRSAGTEACWPGRSTRVTVLGVRKELRVAVWEDVHGAPPEWPLSRQCETAACVNPVHFAPRKSKNAADPFVAAFRAARTRRGLTIPHIAERSGVHEGRIRAWLRFPNQTVWTEDLRAVVAVLEAPELLDLRETRARRIVLTCVDCGTEHTYLPGQLASHIRQQRDKGTVLHAADDNVDWVAGTGTYRCLRCNGSRVGLEYVKSWRKTPSEWRTLGKNSRSG